VSKPIPASPLSTIAITSPSGEVPEEDWGDEFEKSIAEAQTQAQIEQIRKDIRNLNQVYNKDEGRLSPAQKGVMTKYGYRGSTTEKNNDEMDGWVQEQLTELKEQLRKMGATP
jgi:hypothetical protein